MSADDGRPERVLGADDEDRLAEARDDLAQTADVSAAKRDWAAEDRDAVSEAYDEVATPPAGRQRAAHDRRAAAEDRDDALDDRTRARRDRRMSSLARGQAAWDRNDAASAVADLREMLLEAEDSAEAMVLVGQAQGKLMERHQYSALEAICQLAVEAEQAQTDLHDAARRLTQDVHDPEAGDDDP